MSKERSGVVASLKDSELYGVRNAIDVAMATANRGPTKDEAEILTLVKDELAKRRRERSAASASALIKRLGL